MPDPVTLGDLLGKQVAQQQQPSPEQQRQISVDKVLQRYARTHLELLEANDELARYRTLLQRLETAYKKAAEEIESLKNTVTSYAARNDKLTEQLKNQETYGTREINAQTAQTIEGPGEGQNP